MDKQPEIHSHTSMRGVAALMVVLLHYQSFLAPDASPARYTGLVDMGHLWVDFFFVLSGFVLSYVYRLDAATTASGASLRRYGAARFARIYPLHAASLLATVLIFAAIGFVALGRGGEFCCLMEAPYRSFDTLLANVFLVQAWALFDDPTWNIPAWSISAEFACYLLFALLLWLAPRARRVLLAALWLAALGVLTWGLAVGARSDGDFAFSVPRALFGFTLGMGAFVLRGRADRLSTRALGLLQLAVVTSLLLGMHWRADNFVILTHMPSLVVLTAGDRGLLAAALHWSPLHWLGLHSYSIYMWHYPLKFVALKVAASSKAAPALGSTPGSLLFVAALLVLCLGIAAWSYRCLEGPLRRALVRPPRQPALAAGAAPKP